jgi:hypothetical protein
MKNKLLPFFVFVLAGLLVTCSSSPSNSNLGLLSANLLDLVQNSVFEVVIEKPAEDYLVYDRELNWENVPFAIRTDNYYSIGTAFAISNTELVTAFHVIHLGYESMIFSKYFIRDSQGTVYEVDQITGGSNEKDYLIFTVKGKTFNKFFQFERNYKIGDPVFSIGNAMGEGIVVRNGLILGTVPEEDSGRWNLLKSSADGNPGNSGGPLVTPNGKVVALVTARQDNIIYSLPADVILDGDRSVLSYRTKFRFGHLILTNNLNNTLEMSVPLPDTYTGVRDTIRAVYEKNYDTSMSALFDEAPQYINGPNNAFILDSSLSSSFPEISFVDPNDDNWKLSSLNRNTRAYSLNDDGRLYHIQVSGYDFYKIKRPKSVSLERICTDPKYIMDLILQNIRTDRTLYGNDRYRILSLGQPSSTGRYQDVLGRTWLTAYWTIGFADEVYIMYILPLPDGPVLVSTTQDSSFLQDYNWDLRKICDHIFTAYAAAFEDWTHFFAMKETIPRFLQDIHFQWNSSERSFSLECGGLSVNSDSNVFDWTGNSELFLAPSWYKQKDTLTFGFRKITFNRDPWADDFIVLYRNIIPDPKLGSGAMESWNNLVAERYPFNGIPAISARENTGSIGAILNRGPSAAETIFSVYLSMENPQDDESLLRRFNALKQSISIID